LNEDTPPGRYQFLIQTATHWIALIWLAIVVVGYFVMHKPFSPEFAVSLAWIIWRSFVACALVSVAGGIGYKFLKNVPMHPLAALSAQTALGLGSLSLGVMAVGYLGGYYFGIASIAMLLLLFFTRRSVFHWWTQWGFIRIVWQEGSAFGKGIAFITLVILAATLVIALAPPLQFDALVYHLALPQEYLTEHRLSYITQNFFWGMPQTAEMLYTWAMSLAGARAAAVTGWLVGLVTLLGLLGLIYQAFGSDPAWAGISALMAGFTPAFLLGWAYIDWWMLLFSIAFLIFILLWSGTNYDQYLGVAGLFAGFATGTKYTAGVLLLCGAAVIFIRHRADYRRLFQSILWFGLPAMLVFSPWLAKNFLATGNPVYPFFIPAGVVTKLRLNLYQGGVAWGSWLDFVFLPLRATFWGVHNSTGYNASIGPLLLGLGLTAGIGWRSREHAQRTSLLVILQLSLVGILIWMIAGRFSSYLLQTRLYLVIFPGLAVLASAGYNGLSKIVETKVRFRVIAGILVCLVLGLTGLEVCLDTLKMGAGRQVTGLSTEQSYLADNLGWFEPAMEALHKLPPGSRVLMLLEPRSFYCAPVCEPDEVIDRWLRERYDGRQGNPATSDEILQKWLAAGYTHLLYYQSGANFLRRDDPNYTLQDWAELDSLLEKLPRIENYGDTYSLYQMKK
jgi:hypothetical protein